MDFIGTEKLPSVINDPFLKDKCKQILIVFNNSDKGGDWYANVEFRNGNTKGEQTTNRVKTFDEVIIALKQIFNSVK